MISSINLDGKQLLPLITEVKCNIVENQEVLKNIKNQTKLNQTK